MWTEWKIKAEPDSFGRLLKAFAFDDYLASIGEDRLWSSMCWTQAQN